MVFNGQIKVTTLFYRILFAIPNNLYKTFWMIFINKIFLTALEILFTITYTNIRY